ncbi:hypothetical protein IMSHALPRED_003291 [Imshaugia aleurites]|uniref:Uncharacterized protein n=1 Tax=Imshaugia aleurites TaxID=172621 RepID=A0A8H3IIF7_9LECA|nr:hypothetical protein IMSHALPRED_003291 [Imshaugia aleurites]
MPVIAAATMTSSPLPVIPPEIWTTVLHHYGNSPEDLFHLWTQCRQVSQQFKAEVERIFVTQHLPTMIITFRLGLMSEAELGLRSWTRLSYLKTEFIGLSEDCETAIFGAVAKELWKVTQIKPIESCSIQVGELRGRAIQACFASRSDEEFVFEIDWKDLLDEVLVEQVLNDNKFTKMLREVRSLFLPVSSMTYNPRKEEKLMNKFD